MILPFIGFVHDGQTSKLGFDIVSKPPVPSADVLVTPASPDIRKPLSNNGLSAAAVYACKSLPNNGLSMCAPPARIHDGDS